MSWKTIFLFFLLGVVISLWAEHGNSDIWRGVGGVFLFSAWTLVWLGRYKKKKRIMTRAGVYVEPSDNNSSYFILFFIPIALGVIGIAGSLLGIISGLIKQ